MTQQQPSDYELRGLDFPMRLLPEARRLMEGAVGVVARQVVREIVAARRDGLPVALLEVAAGPEPLLPDWQEVVLRVTLLATPEEAVAAWESLDRRVEKLRESLDIVQREVLDEAVALEMVWKEDGSANGGDANGPA